MKQNIKFSELKSRTEALVAKFITIPERIGDDISGRSIAVQSNILVVAALAKIVTPILENLQQTIGFITAEDNGENGSGEEKLTIDPEIVEATEDAFGVSADSVLPFALTTSAITLPIAEEMIAKAIALLDEADTFTSEQAGNNSTENETKTA